MFGRKNSSLTDSKEKSQKDLAPELKPDKNFVELGLLGILFGGIVGGVAVGGALGALSGMSTDAYNRHQVEKEKSEKEVKSNSKFEQEQKVKKEVSDLKNKLLSTKNTKNSSLHI